MESGRLTEAQKAAHERLERINQAFFEWYQGPGGRRYGNDSMAAFQAGYLAALRNEPAPPDQVPMPPSPRTRGGEDAS